MSTNEVINNEKVIRLFLNESQRLECIPSILAVLLKGTVDTILIIGKNTLKSSYYVMRFEINLKSYKFAKKRKVAALKNESLMALINSLNACGFTEEL